MKLDELPVDEHLPCTVSEGVATIRIARPARRNAFTNAMYRTLSDLLLGLDRLEEVRCIVVRGSGGIFSSGSDMAHFIDLEASERDAHFRLVAELLSTPARMGKPVVAAVQGLALGGGTGLTAACDLAIAQEGASFGLPEIAVGLWPCTLLPVLARAVGGRKAYELALLGQRIDAAEALALGLVSRTVSADRFEAELSEMTARIATASPVAVQMGKRAFQQSLDTEFHAATRFMGQVMALNSATDDARKGVAAFLARAQARAKHSG
jgi:enoyl-CoA hydratase/carnithine racemase